MKKEETKSFEEALARLEEIVRLLENGKNCLDESLTAFEEGIGLVKLCNEKLTKAEQRVMVLMQDENGEMQEKEFPQSEA